MATEADVARVTELLGRAPQGDFEVVVRRSNGDPVVVLNHPLLHDGTPMPTLFWLVGKDEYTAVSRLEAAGGVDQAEAEVDPAELESAHVAYARLRDAALPAGHIGPARARASSVCTHISHGGWPGVTTPSALGWPHESTTRASCDMSDKVGVVDIGSNSVKLLVLDANDVMHRDSVVTRLGSGVNASGNLSDDSIAATRVRFGEIRALLDDYGVTNTWAVATAAVRNAANAAPFVEMARNTLGCDVAVIDGLTEGNLSFLGAQRNLALPPGSGPVTVIDIGGGSTEFAVGDPANTPQVVSIPYGARNLTERILRHDPPRPEELTNAIGAVIDEVDDVLREIPELETCERLVGVAGTVVTIAMVELGLHTYDASALHGMHLERDAAEDVFRTLATESLADRVYNPGLPADRADIIVGGCCTLVAILRKLQLQGLTVSTTSLADGVAMVARQRREQLSSGSGLADVLRDFFRP